MILRFKVWKNWYKKCVNGRGYKFLVLFGLRHSPTFEMELVFYKAYRKYGNEYLEHSGYILTTDRIRDIIDANKESEEKVYKK